MAPVYAVSLVGSYMGQEIVYARHFVSEDEDALTPDVVFLEALATAIVGPVKAMHNEDYLLEHMHVRNVEPLSVGFSYVPDGWPVVGERDGEHANPVLALKVRFQGTAIKHPIRGLLATCASVVEDQNSQYWHESYQTACQAFGATLAAGYPDFLENTWQGCIWSPTYLDYNLISLIGVDNVIRTQNSRKLP